MMDSFKKVTIGGCAFQCAKMLPRVLANISAMAAFFPAAHIVFFYDVSQDSTLRILQEYSQSSQKLKVTILINPANERSRSRTVNIARARNGILQLAREEQCDLLAMIDLNEYACVGDLQPETLQAVFTPELLPQWDAISFTREAGYYDYWALSFPGFIYSFMHYPAHCDVVTKMRDVFPRVLQKQKEQKKALIPVYSAFNGFSLYKLNLFKDCVYSADIELALFPQHELRQALRWGTPISSKHNDCEHRHFHLQANQKHGARIRIYPCSLFRKLSPSIEGLRGPA